MELGPDILKGLQILSDTSHIDESDLKILSNDAIGCILCNKKIILNESCGKVDPGAWKQLFASIITLFTEAAKHDLEASSFVSFLEDQNCQASHIKELSNTYNNFKQDIRQQLGSISTNLPHVVNADWILQQYYKSSDVGRIGKPKFSVSLDTETSNESKTVQFSCTFDQMQDLVFKLKDACKCLEKNGQNL